MANLRTNNLSGEQGRNAIKGSVVFGGGDDSSAGLTIADNSDLELSSETNWTIEFWLWLNGPTHGDYDVILEYKLFPPAKYPIPKGYADV